MDFVSPSRFQFDTGHRFCQTHEMDFVRRLSKKILLVATALALFLLVEAAFRVAGVGAPRAPFIRENGRVRDNPYFGLLFFPRQLARHAPHFRVAQDHPDTFRVVVLGESAAQGDPAPVYGMPRHLEVILAARMPGRRVEVINAAMTAINSHAIRLKANRLRMLKPDAVVLYIGHNEVIGPYGPGSVFGRPLPRFWIRAHLFLRATRLGQATEAAVQRLTGIDSASHRWHGIALFDRHRVAFDSPALRKTHQHFERNLRDIIDEAHAAGALVVLCTPAVNERMAPFAPEFGAGAEWARARELATAGLEFEARAAFRRAVDLDGLRVRADSVIQDTVRRLAREWASRSLRLVESAKRLGDRPELFLDHVHFTFEGNYRLAQMIADAIKPGTTLSLEEIKQALAFDNTAEARIWRQMAERFRYPPYTRQADHTERIKSIQGDLQSLEAHATDPATRAELIREAGLRRPDDVELAILWAHALVEAGQRQEAIVVLQRAIDRIPHHTLAHLALADMLAAEGREQEALRHYRLGSPLASDPLAEAHAALGATLADAGRFERAEMHLRAALSRAPRHTLARYNLALLLGKRSRSDTALTEYEHLLRLDPGFTEARYNRAILLIRLNRLEEAEAELHRICREQPEYEPAQRALDALRTRRSSIR